jgi:p-cumate 2,3-dioxygenase beta subunit
MAEDSGHDTMRNGLPPVSLRQEVEDFLYEEAALLDDWRLDDWLTLFTEDARYIVPATDFPEGDPRLDMVLIDDDIIRLRARVVRLKSRHAHREYPWSRTRRFISNVRITEVDGDNIFVTMSCLVYRARMGEVAPYVGKHLYTLTRVDGRLKIRHRRAELDLETLDAHGAVSIIL